MVLKVNTKQVGLETSIESVVNKINRRGLKVRINSNDFTQPLGRITQKADEFTKSLEASNARVIAFGASAAIIGGVAKGFEQLVVQAVKFEKLLTDINVVLGTSSSNLAKFGDNLFKVARNTSQSLDVAAEAALEFSRQGLTMEETLRRTNDALILTRLTGIQAADAVSGLTAAVNGFADAGLTTTSIINKLAAVDVKFAVSADDLINALARAGAVAQDAGVNFDQLVGAVTSAQQITARGGAVIGNSFKTIFTRIQRSSTLDRLQELGIAVRDIRGYTLPALTVLTNLSKTYDTLGSSTKAAVAEQVGGVFQINVLKAALKDLNRENSLYAQATQISTNATDQAQQKNAQLQKTISSLAAQTSLSIQELSANIGELALAPGISKLLDAINSLGTGLNDLLGKNAEGLGSDFGKAVVRGIGSVITGPGMVLAFGIFAKLFGNALKFAKSSLKDVLGIVTQKDKERKIQESIVLAMNNNKTLAQELHRMAGDKLRQEELILAVIERQTSSIEAQQNIARSIAPGLAKKGVNPDLTLKSKKGGAASGFIPNFSSSVTPFERQKERASAIKSGYSPGNVSDIDIKGVGRVVYNTAETVKKFPGFRQPAIMPPQGSDAGQKYKHAFTEKHGFNPYAFNGFVPNFIDPRTRAEKIRDTLKDPANKGIKFNNFKTKKSIDFKSNSPSESRFIEIFLKQKTGDGSLYLDRLRKINGYTESQINHLKQLRKSYQSGSRVSLNGKEVLPSGFIPSFSLSARKIPGTNILELPKARMFTETSKEMGSGINAKKMTGTHLMEAPIDRVIENIREYLPELEALKNAGVNVIRRKFQFSNFDKTNRGARATGNAARRKNMTNDAKGKYFESQLHDKYLKTKGYSPTAKNAKVDFIKKGQSPIESKFGGSSVKDADLIAKSIRLYRDKSIQRFLESQGMRYSAQSMRRKSFDDSIELLKSSGIDASGTLKEQVKLVKDYRVAEGLIPNFVNYSFSSKDLTRYSKQKSPQEKKKDQLKKSTQDGRAYENIVGSVFGKVPTYNAAMDYSSPFNVAQPKYIGSGTSKISKNIMSQKHADAHVGFGHSPADLMKKFLNSGLVNMDQLEQARESNSILDLSDSFTEIIRKGSRGDFIDTKRSNKYKVGFSFRKDVFNPKSSGFIPNFADNYVIQALAPQSGFYNKGNFVKDKNQAETMSRSRAVMVSNILMQNRKIKSRIFQMNEGRLMGDSGIFDRDKPGRATGLIPNFSAASNLALAGGLVGKNKFGNVDRKKLSTLISSHPHFGPLMKKHLTWDAFPKNEKKQLHRWLLKQGISRRALQVYGFTSMHGKDLANTISDFAMHSGLIPNFANPLEQAILRERKAGLPDSKIRIDQDNRLKSKENPLGLAVTNTRDEPLGVQQGIERARAMGIDPKTHGASNGLIPNFAEKRNPQVFGEGLSTASDKAAKNINKLGESSDKTSMASGGLMTGMFALTSLTYALEGAIGEAESGFGKISKVTNSFIMGLSQSAMIYAGLNEVSKGLSGGLGKAVKGLGVLGAVVGTAIPVYKALKENTTWLDSGLDTLRKSAAKTAKGIDALGTAISSAEGIEATRKELAELNTGAMAGTYQGEMQRLKLNAQLIKQQNELTNQSAKLGKQLNLTEAEVKAMTDGTASGMKKLQEAMLQAQQQMAVTSAMQSYVGATDKNLWEDEIKDPLTASIQKTNLAQMSAAAMQGNPIELNNVYDEIDKILQDTRELKLGPYAPTGKVGESYVDIDREKVKKDVSESDLPTIIKAQIKSALDAKMSMAKLSKFFAEQEALAGQFTQSQEEQTSESEANLELIRQIKKAQQQTLNSMELGKIDYSIEQNLQKLNQSHMMQEMSYRAKLNDSLGILSNSASIDLELKNREQQIQNDYINKKSAVNRETVEAQQNLIKQLFVGGGKFKPEEMFSDLGKDFKEKDKTITITSSSTDSAINNENPMGPTNNQRALTRTIKGETFQGGTKEAFEGNLNKIISDLENSTLKDLAAQLRKTKLTEDLVKNQEHANQITFDYLSNLDETKQIEAIRVLQTKGIISKTADIDSIIQQILDTEETKLEGLSEEKKQKRKNLALISKELSLGKQTVAAAQERFRAYSELAISEKGLKGNIQEQLQESLDFNIMQSSMNKHIGETTRSILLGETYRADLVKSMASTMEGELTKEVQSLVNQEARLKAEQELRKNTEVYSQMMAIKAKTEVGRSIIGMQDSAELDSKTLEEEKKQKKFAIEAETNLTKAKNAAEREQLAFNEKLKAGGFQLDALNEMAAASREFTASMIKAREKLAAGEFFNEGVRSVEQDEISAAQGVQKAQGKVAATQGNSITNSRATLELAAAQRELNIQQNKGTLFADSIAVKIAETNKELAMFGQTLAETSFDAVKSGFRGLFDDLVDGTKSAGDAALNFFSGIAKAIQDKLLDRASSQLTAGLFDAVGLDGNYRGGLITGYAKGGTVGGGKVPSMLTAGEYVVKKKIVDRLGSNTLDSINQTGSLDELYNKPNNDIFDITTEDAAAIPPIMRFQDGGNVSSYLAQRDMGYDRVSENERSTVNGEIVNDFTNSLDSLFKKHNKQSLSEKHSNSYNSTQNSSNYNTSNAVQYYRDGGSVLNSAVKGSSGLQNIAKGGGYMLGHTLGSSGSKDEDDQPKPPEAPKNQRLNTRSRLNLDAAGADRSKMSQRFKANDSYTQEMKKYHLDMYEFTVQQKNAAEKERAGKIASIAGTAAIAGGMALGKGISNMYSDYKHKQNMNYIDNAYTQTHIDKGTASSMFDKSISDVNKTLNYEYHTDISSLKKDTLFDGGDSFSYDNKNSINSTQSKYSYSTSPTSIAGGNNYTTSSLLNFDSSSASHNSKAFNNTEMQNYLSSYSDNNNLLNTSNYLNYKNHGGIINNKSIKPYSYYNKGGSVNVSNNPYSYFNKGGSVYSTHSNPYSYFNRGGSVINVSHNPYSHFNRGGSVHSIHNSPHSYFNSGGSVNNTLNRPYSYFNSGGLTNVSNSNYSPSFQSQSNIQRFSGGGKVNGPGGIDKVGPVLLDKGEYVIKASSVNKVEKKYPGFFDRLNSSKMKDGGKVGETNVNNAISNVENSKSSDNNSVVVNINISSNGSTSVDGGSTNQQAFASKIKDAVTGIISQEKRVGGMLRGK